MRPRVIITLFISLLLLGCASTDNAAKPVRKPAFAGTFYPAEASVLEQIVASYLGSAKGHGALRAIVVPHAGYIYSGAVAGAGFSEIDRDFKRVILIGTNHASVNVQGISVGNYSYYETPLGPVRVSAAIDELMSQEPFTYVPAAHSAHILEVELPFLQEKLTDFEIIPLVTGGLNLQQINEAAGILMQYIDDDTLLVISSDLSHYHDYETAKNLDIPCIEGIGSLDFSSIARCEACGIYGILIMATIAKEKGWTGHVLDYRNSGDTAGDKSRVVGYSSIAFYENGASAKISIADQEFLLGLSRATLESYVRDRKVPAVNADTVSADARKKLGCFVTLNKDGQLRGCIGHIIGQKSLYECVAENTVNAAVNDKRFMPVTAEELDGIEIEISVLTVPQQAAYKSAAELLNLLTHDDGVIIRSGTHQSTYLPQVWEQLPDKETFLANLCLKAGLDSQCWADAQTQVYTYNAQVFHEN
ncbi:MAG: AmmeMemoRadiSam system protein B [archaeon]